MLFERSVPNTDISIDIVSLGLLVLEHFQRYQKSTFMITHQRLARNLYKL